jgi:hypothetical protein
MPAKSPLWLPRLYDRAAAGCAVAKYAGCAPIDIRAARHWPPLDQSGRYLGNGNAVLYLTCFNAKLDLIFSIPGIGVS